ncbi:deoxyuridine 5'-triphosphate nucleotidohydrolase [Candidatus Uhrbacteria bacterium]|nr:deoxyuridine 5'-triphosphate nucleotidohydrolase [Candidatus Uhrbacteria bacterium]
MILPVEIFKCHPDAVIPVYYSTGACAFDLSTIEDVIIQPGEIVRLRTGLVICVPENYVMIVVARSSLPKKYGLCFPQGIGIVDNDYCGPTDEAQLQLLNFTDQPVEIRKGDRLAQAMLVPFAKAEFKEVIKLTNPNRGGFGSTG